LSENDVLIVGGGPAGAAAAIVSAQAGLSVKIVERPRPGSAHSYDAVHPGVFPLLDCLGVGADIARAGFIRHAGYWAESESSRCFIPFGNDEGGPWLGAQLYRPSFDRILLDRARSLGVEVCQARADDVLIRGGRLCGIRTSDENLSSRFVLDATGRWRWLARRLLLPAISASPPMYARYGVVKAHSLTRDEAPALTTDFRGWTWTAQVERHAYWRIRLEWSDHRVREESSTDDLRNLHRLGLNYGSDVTWSLTESLAGPGYFVIGDAAIILDPASSHGVLRAIMSGMMAAHLVVLTVRSKLNPLLGVQLYSRWMQNWFIHDASRLRELYRGLRHPPSWVMAEREPVPADASNVSLKNSSAPVPGRGSTSSPTRDGKIKSAVSKPNHAVRHEI
jgi:flavin-dependent dehydrogenase